MRYDLLVSGVSAVLDFARIVGTTFLIEKTTRKGVSKESATFIYLALLALAFVTEVCSARVERSEASLTELSQRSLLADKSDSYAYAPMKDLFLNAVLLKGALAAAAIGANHLGASD